MMCDCLQEIKDTLRRIEDMLKESKIARLKKQAVYELIQNKQLEVDAMAERMKKFRKKHEEKKTGESGL